MAQFKHGKLLLVIVVVLRCANGGLEYWVNGEIVIITYMTNMNGHYCIIEGTTGDDRNPGSIEEPFKTLTRVRDVIRIVSNTTGIPEGGVTVTVAPGDYDFTKGPLQFTSKDSGDVREVIT